MSRTTQDETQVLHSEIGRSRRRLDRHALSLLSETTDRVAVVRWLSGTPSSTWFNTLTTGIAVARWFAGRNKNIDNNETSFWSQAAQGIEQLVRHFRVAVRQSQRPHRVRSAEVTDE